MLKYSLWRGPKIVNVNGKFTVNVENRILPYFRLENCSNIWRKMKNCFFVETLVLLSMYTVCVRRFCRWTLKSCGWDLACGWDLSYWLEWLTANAEVATVLGSILASSDTAESEGRQMKQCWIQYIEIKKNSKVIGLVLH